jgi:ribonuclease-3
VIAGWDDDVGRDTVKNALPEPGALEEAIGLKFRDPALLRRALTHGSYLNENPDCSWGDNQRLEFLGDAVVDLVAAEFAYARFPDWQEGKLTRMRAEWVRADTLAHFAAEKDLGAYLVMGHGAEQSGARAQVAVLSDAFEALVGAIYLDGGLEAARQFIVPFLDALTQARTVAAGLRDPKTRLQEWTQSVMHASPVYATVEETGPDHAPQFTVEVLLQDQVLGRGTGRNKQSAELAAARAALEALPPSEPC